MLRGSSAHGFPADFFRTACHFLTEFKFSDFSISFFNRFPNRFYSRFVPTIFFSFCMSAFLSAHTVSFSMLPAGLLPAKFHINFTSVFIFNSFFPGKLSQKNDRSRRHCCCLQQQNTVRFLLFDCFVLNRDSTGKAVMLSRIRLFCHAVPE